MPSGDPWPRIRWSAWSTCGSSSRQTAREGPRPARRRRRRPATWSSSPAPPGSPSGDVILCDVAREDASVVIEDLKELGIAPRRLDRARADRLADLRRGQAGRAGGARPALRRGRLGGGRGAHLGEHRAGRQLPRLHDPRLPDRLGRDLPRLADPDRRRDGRRPRVRPAGRPLRGGGRAPPRRRPALADRPRDRLPGRDHRRLPLHPDLRWRPASLDAGFRSSTTR